MKLYVLSFLTIQVLMVYVGLIYENSPSEVLSNARL